MNKPLFDAEKFFRDYNISYRTCNNGWLAINCPIHGCKQSDYKMGYNSKSNIFNCFRCSTHSVLETVKELLNVSWNEANVIIKQYSSHIALVNEFNIKNDRPLELKLPRGLQPLNKYAKNYLKKRNFDPDLLENKYGFKCMDHTGELPNRIFIPILIHNQMVSYTTRSYSDFCDSALRYFSCPEPLEIIPHKTICYNWDFCTADNLIITEGPMDAIRIGDGAVCTFGIVFCPKQIELLKQKKNIFIIYDPEPKANKKAQELAISLSMYGLNVEKIELETGCDAGDLSNEQVKYLRNELLFT